MHSVNTMLPRPKNLRVTFRASSGFKSRIKSAAKMLSKGKEVPVTETALVRGAVEEKLRKIESKP